MNRGIGLVIWAVFLTTAALGGNGPAVRWGHQLMMKTDDCPRAAAVGSDGGDGATGGPGGFHPCGSMQELLRVYTEYGREVVVISPAQPLVSFKTLRM